MGAKERGALTEPMFYVLMSFLRRDMCGTETLYTILGKFQDEKMIEEVEVSGRRRTYRITGKGRAALTDEVERLRACLTHAEEEGL